MSKHLSAPKRFRRTFALSLLSAWQAIAGVPPTLMAHPLFGNQFIPAELPFPGVSGAVVNELKLRQGQYWKFASFATQANGKARTYILIAGISTPESGMAAEPDFGAMVLFEEGKYRIIGSADDLAISGKFSSKIQHGVYESAVDELIRAFGDVMRARSALCQQKVTFEVVGADLYAILNRRGLGCG